MRTVPGRKPYFLLKVILFALLLAATGMSLAVYRGYSAFVTAERPSGEVLLLSEPSVTRFAQGLAALYEERFPGSRVIAREMPVEDALALLASGNADLGLYYESPNHEGLLYHHLFWDHQVAVSPLFSPSEALTLQEAMRLPEATLQDEFGSGCFTVKWHDLEPGMRLLPVEGIMPNPANLKDGSYPLTRSAGLYQRKNTPERLLFLLRLVRPNAQDVENLRGLAQEAHHLYYPGMERHITLAVAGDIMLARGVDARIRNYGWDYPLALVADLLCEADLAIANLESPIGEKGTPIPGKMIWFRARPESAKALVQAGLDAVCLANNHILDYDTENFLETMEILDDIGMKHFGGGRDIHEARTPLILEAGGIRVACLAYSEFAHPDLFWSVQYPRTFEAKEGVPGVTPIRKEYISEDIARARQEADVVVTMFHWGAEDTHHPDPFWIDQVDIARFTVDAGADLVIGTHPHAVQGLELYNGKYIAYSLGNLVMDQRREFQKESVILSFTITERGVSALEIHPCYITECQPALLEGEGKRALLQRLKEYSLPLKRG